MTSETILPRLTKSQREMLDRIARGTAEKTVMELLLIAAGGRAKATLRALLDMELVEAVQHPTVKNAARTEPVTAYVVRHDAV